MNRRRILVVAAVGLCAALWTYACGDGATEPSTPPPDPPQPTTVTVSPATAQLATLGATVQLSAEVLDQNGNAMAGATVTWASSAASVATVSSTGLVTAVGNGPATITATAGAVSGSAAVTVAQEVSAVVVSLSGTVNHGWGGWTDPHTNGFGDGASYRPGSSSAGESGAGTAAPAVTTPDGYVIGAVVEVVDGPDAGRQTTTDDRGRYVLEALQQGEFTIRATAEGFASVGGVVDLASDGVLDLAISQPPTPQPTSPFPDTDPAWLQALSSDYPYAHQVANVRVFSDISPTFSREHAEHLKRVWEFFHALYGTKNGDWMDVYYTSDPTVYMKAAICSTDAATMHTDTRNSAWCPLDYVRWFIIPYQIPDFGTQLHEIGHGFLYARWPQAWGDSFPSLWLVEGTAMYWEGGVFTDDGSLRVSTPFPWCANGFPDPGSRLIPLAELLRLGEAFYPDPRPTYPQSCMLFTYLEKRAPGVLFALIYRINSGQIVSNDQLITALLDLTGKSISELEEAYQSYAWSMR